MPSIAAGPVDGFRIVTLDTVPETTDVIERWYREAWPDWYGSGGPGNAVSDLKSCLDNESSLPRCLIALDRGSKPLGTASLRDTSPGSDIYPGVWLTALLVPEILRRRGIGSALVAAAESEAGRLGFDAIHATTGSAKSLFERGGWQFQDTLKSGSEALMMFRKPLKQS